MRFHDLHFLCAIPVRRTVHIHRVPVAGAHDSKINQLRRTCNAKRYKVKMAETIKFKHFHSDEITHSANLVPNRIIPFYFIEKFLLALHSISVDCCTAIDITVSSVLCAMIDGSFVQLILIYFIYFLRRLLPHFVYGDALVGGLRYAKM